LRVQEQAKGGAPLYEGVNARVLPESAAAAELFRLRRLRAGVRRELFHGNGPLTTWR